MTSPDALRIIDVNRNRALEALRVVEDYIRFVSNDRFLSGECKQLRHDLVSHLESLGDGSSSAWRHPAGDVGQDIAVATEYERRDPAHVALANFMRLEQALRSLEEYLKCISTVVASAVERLRYRAYCLHRAVETLMKVHERLSGRRLYVLLEGHASVAACEREARELIEHGADMLQLRDKSLTDAELLGRARALRLVTRETGTLLVINDRADLSVVAEADGVHLGQDDLPVAEARRLVGPHRLVGVSTHSLEQARRAVLQGADYLGCGPVFPSKTKTFGAFPGPDYLRTVAEEISTPAFAIGGIGIDNLDAVLASGIRRIAVSGAVRSRGELRRLAARLSDSARQDTNDSA